MKYEAHLRCLNQIKIITAAAVCLLMVFGAGSVSAYDDRWTTLAAPERPSNYLNLRGIWGTSEKNVYSAGHFFDLTGTVNIPIILHYDGLDVEEMTLPDASTKNLFGIWGSSNSDIYAVGRNFSAIIGVSNPYMLHYDGTSWSEATSSLPAIGQVGLWGVWGTSASDIFVTCDGAILHYDGTAWTEMTLPAMTPTPKFRGIWGTSSTDVWAVGYQYDGSTAPYYTGIILHYDGSNWTLRQQITDLNLNDVWGASASDVFFAGYAWRADNGEVARIFHWDGTAFSEMTVPDLIESQYGSKRGKLDAIWGTSGNDVFATGAWTVLHYDGSSWSQQLNSSGLSGWAYNSSHIFKGGWDFAKYGSNVQATTGVKVKVATGTANFEFLQAIDPATIVDDRNRPSSLPYGLFDFSIPVPANDRIRVTFQFPGKLDDNLRWFKHNPDSGWLQYNQAYFETVTDEFGAEHTIVRIYITDNGDGDIDPRPGYINDPSGPGNEGGGVGGGGGGGGGCFLNLIQ